VGRGGEGGDESAAPSQTAPRPATPTPSPTAERAPADEGRAGARGPRIDPPSAIRGPQTPPSLPDATFAHAPSPGEAPHAPVSPQPAGRRPA
jgi:hypothetical protein